MLTYTPACSHTHLYIEIHTCMLTHLYLPAHATACSQARTHTYTHTCVLAPVPTHTPAHTPKCPNLVLTCTHVYTCTQPHVQLHIHAHTYILTNSLVHTHRACMHTCPHAYTATCTPSSLRPCPRVLGVTFLSLLHMASFPGNHSRLRLAQTDQPNSPTFSLRAISRHAIPVPHCQLSRHSEVPSE